MRTAHLFAGAGGGLLADLILGHTPVLAVEIDPYACQILRERRDDGWFPGLHVHEGDVRMFDPSDWAGRVDSLHAGFPCQDISVAGAGAGISGERSGLWPTPTATTARQGVGSKEGNGRPLLARAEMLRPPPSANDWKGSTKDGQRRGQLTDPAMGVIPGGGRLNPTWVEWLMAWPLGFTVSRHWATAKSRSKRRSRTGS